MNIPTGFAQVNLQWTGTGTPTGAEVVFGVNQDFGMGPADVCTAVEAAIEASDIDEVWSANATLSNIHVKLGPNTTGPAADLGVSFVGLNGGNTGYAGASLLVHKITATGGRKGRGRMFIPAIPEGDIAIGGNIEVAPLATAVTQFDAFLAALTTELVPMVLLHNDPGDAPDDVTALLVDSKAATQRNRQRR